MPNNANEDQSQLGETSSIALGIKRTHALISLSPSHSLMRYPGKTDKTISKRGNSTVKGGELCVATRNLDKQATNLSETSIPENGAEGNSEKGREDTFCRNVQFPKSHHLEILPTRMLCTEKRIATE